MTESVEIKNRNYVSQRRCPVFSDSIYFWQNLPATKSKDALLFHLVKALQFGN